MENTNHCGAYDTSRLAVHCFGIDITLNDALLLALTRQQGGSFHSLHPNDDISAAVSTLGRTLRQPVLVDMKLSNGWETADCRLPDLYAGQVHYACAKSSRTCSLSTTALDAAGKAVNMQFETTEAQNPAPYLHWCKTRIQRLLAEDAQSAAAIELSRAANVICELTAFVAWDNAEKVAVATHELIEPNPALSGPSLATRSGLQHAPRLPCCEVEIEDRVEDLEPRAPVVAIMGHTAHGKTSLLDAIRKPNVAAGEAGGATQHIGAYTISLPNPARNGELQPITFLDTPGEAAFSALRAQCANVTDIVLLVVAANEGIMPQTIEALNHARAARVPIIVAVNKIDHPNANPLLVRQQLQDKGLVPDDWGGDTIFVEVSALTKQGVDKLIEMILLQAGLMELKANPSRRAKCNLIEAGFEPGGPTATVLVRKGTLRISDIIICGQYYGRVHALISADGQCLKEAGPSVAVRLLGLNGVPEAGLEVCAVEDEKAARELAEQRAWETRELARWLKAADESEKRDVD